MKKAFLLFLFLFAVVSLNAQSKFSAKIKIIVQHDTESVKNEIYSYYARELRSLNDVLIVDDNEDFKIYVISVDSSVDGKVLGYAVTTIITRSVKYNSSAKDKNGNTIVLNYDDLQDFGIINTPTRQLRESISKTIVNFDINILEPERKFFRLFN